MQAQRRMVIAGLVALTLVGVLAAAKNADEHTSGLRMADAAKEFLAKLSPEQVKLTELAGEKIQTVLTHAPGNGAPIGGLKVMAESGWFAARPSGTENIYKIYGESFQGADHLRRVLEEAQTIVSAALAAAPERNQGRVAGNS